MELITKPYYNKESCFIDTDKSFTESFDYEAMCNICGFKAGFYKLWYLLIICCGNMYKQLWILLEVYRRL